MPIPGKAKGEVVVIFDVDETGKVLDLQFTPTKDGNYKQEIEGSLRRRAFPAGHQWIGRARARQVRSDLHALGVTRGAMALTP